MLDHQKVPYILNFWENHRHLKLKTESSSEMII